MLELLDDGVVAGPCENLRDCDEYGDDYDREFWRVEKHIHGLPLFEIGDVADNPLNLGVEKLFISLIKFGDADAFFLADVKLLLQRLVFCHLDCGVERSRLAVW